MHLSVARFLISAILQTSLWQNFLEQGFKSGSTSDIILAEVLGARILIRAVLRTSLWQNFQALYLCFQAWKAWFDEDAPEESPIPDGYATTLDTFRKLLLIRSWCPDRTVPMAKTYVAETMGTAVSLLSPFPLWLPGLCWVHCLANFFHGHW